MAKVEIYTSMFCGFCHRAKSLLTAKGVTFNEIDVGMDAQLRAEMSARASGHRSVPQVFIGGRHIGGCDDLYALERKGELDSLLADLGE